MRHLLRSPAGSLASMLVVGLVLSGCEPPTPDGLAPTPPGGGPKVVFDLDARPIPEIPFPNDLATRPDPSSITGRRINASLVAPTSFEETFRGRLDELDGFSTWAPATVRFDAPLDVANILARHGPDLGFDDDVAYLIDLETGEPVPLDLGNGAIVFTLERPDRYFPNDPRSMGSNLVFETEEEDLDGDGALDAGEDTDSDGVLDHPNTSTPGGDPVDDLLTCYERETSTLLLRPLVPLRPESRYAVVLTSRLVGIDGEPVRSPFEFVNHTQQTEALRPLETHLPALGLALDDVAFAWAFTTQSTTRDLEELRMGLYGEGPYAWLASDFPAETLLENGYDDPSTAPINPFVVPISDLLGALGPLANALLGDDAVVQDLFASFEAYAAYVVIGRAATPLLLTDEDAVWSLDRDKGFADVVATDLPWMLTIPKERPADGITAPFPVAIYVHGTGGFRMEALGFAAHLTKFGIATVGFDGYAHGMALPNELEALLVGFLEQGGLGAWAAAQLDNRTFDITGDGVPDPAGDFWSNNAFRTRDAIRNTAIDVVRLVHIFRGFDGTRTWSFDADGDGVADLDGLAGDFDADGTVDLVGPDGPYFVFGNSLGGIVSAVAAAIEPEIVVAAPISAGGGLTDTTVRSLQQGIPENVILPTLGPFILGGPAEDGTELVMSFYVNSGFAEDELLVHTLDPLTPGTRIHAVNLRTGEEAWGLVNADSRFRLAVPVDAGDPLRVEAIDPWFGELVWSVSTFDRDVTYQGTAFTAGMPLVAPMAGMALPRQSPALRRFLQIAQIALDPGDPINYAPHYWKDPLFADYAGVGGVTNVAIVLTAGDMNVPINTGFALARAAGLVPFLPGEEDPRFGATPHRVLIDHYVYEGLERLRRFAKEPWDDSREILLDPDYLSEGTDGFDAPTLSEPLRLRADLPGGGEGVVRLFYVNPRGHHSIQPADPRDAFDVRRAAINAIGYYFANGGSEWVDDLCLADDSCAFIPTTK